MVTLAHGVVTEGGPNVEALAFAIAIAGVGAILFVQRSVKPIVALAMIVIGGFAALGAFTVLSEEPHQEEAAAQEDPYTMATGGLCLAQSAAQAGDFETARTYFTDRAHVPLHTIAAEAEERDRAVAADLLAAKDAVEEDIFDDAPTERLARDLGTLIEATGAALEVLGREDPLCAA